MNFPATLQLENGIKLSGIGHGAKKVGVGEVVFNTAITGYQEILTDPSYDGQIITFTYPHIGNTGINAEDNESATISARGLIVKNFCEQPSNWRADRTLNDFLLQQNVICISDIDTRYLTKLLRDEGCKIGAIYPSKEINDEEASFEIKKFGKIEDHNLIENVAVKKSYIYAKASNSPKVIALDFGVKENILRILKNKGAEIIVVPSTTSAKDIQKLSPDGIFLSNGPGDPNVLPDVVNQVKEMMDLDIPMFGICLGHQLISLAYGLNITKMPFGHHGANHPVHDLKNNVVYITSQNHNFAVADIANRSDLNVTHISLFDNSIQGIEHLEQPFYSIQCHPEASPGPREFENMFDRFFEEMNAKKK